MQNSLNNSAKSVKLWPRRAAGGRLGNIDCLKAFIALNNSISFFKWEKHFHDKMEESIFETKWKKAFSDQKWKKHFRVKNGKGIFSTKML